MSTTHTLYVVSKTALKAHTLCLATPLDATTVAKTEFDADVDTILGIISFSSRQ